MQPFVDAGIRLLLDDLRDFLASADFDDFKSGEDFASQILDRFDDVLKSNWASDRARQAVSRTTKAIYEYYRLRDVSPFGEKSPVKLKLGGPDTRSIAFVGELDHFYFSKFADNTDKSLRKFFTDSYFENGAALFGRETSEELEDFRRAAGEKLTNLTDRSVKAIVATSAQRVRNWAHVGSLSQARIKLARIVATLDARTTELCRSLDGKILRVGTAQSTIERLSRLEPGDFAAEVYESPLSRAISKEPVKTVEAFIEEDGKTIGDDLVKTGRGFPPFHVNCRTRLEGIIPGASNE